MNRLDHLLDKDKYIRYMDDIIYIGSKSDCINALNLIKLESDRLNLKLSKNKTYIQSISKPIKFLGFMFLLKPTKRVTLKRIKLKLNNEKRRLRKMKRKGIPTARLIEHYQSVRACMKKGSRSGVVKLDRYFKENILC